MASDDVGRDVCVRCEGLMSQRAAPLTWQIGLDIYTVPATQWFCVDHPEDPDHVAWDEAEVDRVHRAALATAVANGRISSDAFRALRKALGLNGKAAAALLGQDPVTISRWEHGAKSLEPLAFAVLAALFLEREHGTPQVAAVLAALHPSA